MSAPRRLAVTLAVPVLVVLAGEHLRLPGVPEGLVDGPARANVSVFALGVTPIVSAFWLVELTAAAVPRLRHLRDGRPEGRAKLTTAALGLTLLLALLQAYATATQLTHALSSDGLFADVATVSLPLSVVSLVGGVFVTLLAAELVTRQGLVNGLVATMAMSLLRGFVADLERHAGLGPTAPGLFGRFMGAPTLDARGWFATALATLAVAFATFAALRDVGETTSSRQSAAYRDARTRIAAPRLPVPSSSMQAYVIAMSALSLPTLSAALTHTGPARTATWLEGPAYGPALLTMTLVVLVALSRVLHGRGELSGLASRLGLTDGARASRGAELAWRASLVPSALFFLVVVLAGLASPLGSLAIVTMVAVAMDLVHATRLAFGPKPLRPVWEERRAAAVPILRALLASRGIATEARGTAFASLWQVFAPYAPVTLLVDSEDEASAREVLSSHVLGEASAAPVPVAPTEAVVPAATPDPGPTRRLLVAAAVAGLALVLARLPAAADVAPPAHRTKLEILRIDDTIAPFADLGDDAIPAGSGISIALESIPVGPNGARRELAYARVVIAPGESKAAARARLDAFLADVPLPEGARFGVEPEIDDERYPEARRESSLRTYVLVGESAISERDVVDAVPVAQGPSGADTSVSVELSSAAAKRFEELTAAWTRRRLAIVLDGEIASAPLVLSAIGGGRISLSVGRGDPDLQAALAAKLAKGLRGR